MTIELNIIDFFVVVPGISTPLHSTFGRFPSRHYMTILSIDSLQAAPRLLAGADGPGLVQRSPVIDEK